MLEHRDDSRRRHRLIRKRNVRQDRSVVLAPCQHQVVERVHARDCGHVEGPSSLGIVQCHEARAILGIPNPSAAVLGSRQNVLPVACECAGIHSTRMPAATGKRGEGGIRSVSAAG